MGQELIVAEILKNKPHGIKLYSPIFGACTFCYIKDESSDICVRRPYNEMSYFNFDGVYHSGGERLLFPSNEMRDWSKFVWERGNILVSNDGNTEVIFDKWYDDTYTSFYCKHYFNNEDENKIVYYETFLCTTERYSLEDKDSIQTYINTIEERFGGKLNRETLEIEKAQPEFRDGDIVATDAAPYSCYSKCIFILKGDLYMKDSKAHSYVFYNINNKYIGFDKTDTRIRDRKIHLATDSEKLQLFDMLTMKGKYWDAEKKQIVDIKEEHQFKPFEKVLVRDYDNDVWRASFFSHTRETLGRYATAGLVWKQCIPYEGNEHLLGTKNNPK